MYKKLQHTILLALAFAFFLKDFVAVSYQVDFFLNQKAYLVKCVNKAKPDLKCNGKCQLALRLKKIELDAKSDLAKHNSKQPLKNRELEAYTLFASFPKLESNSIAVNSVETVTFYFSNYSPNFLPSIFHPPCCLV